MSDLDKIYDSLFDVYKKDYSTYLKQAETARAEISRLKPSAPIDYRPYPKITDKNFYQKFTVKKEFAKYALEEEHPDDFDVAANEKCKVGDFKLTQNQKFVKNFMSPLTPYNSLLLFHSVGVGKTCSAISIAEQYLMAHPNKRVLVILSSNIKENFKKQLFDISKYNAATGENNLCTGSKYPEMVIDRKLISASELDKRIQKLIKERYQFIGFQELANYIEKRIEKHVTKIEKNPARQAERIKEKIKEVFSNRLFIIDEAHNLRISSDTEGKKISNLLTEILEIAENTKLVMLTATPMFNSAPEILYLLKLLHIVDKRDPKLGTIFTKEKTLTEQGAELLKKACKGYVSYMTSANPFSFPFRLYPSINRDPKLLKLDGLELIESKMSSLQSEVYSHMNVKFEINEDIEEEQDEEALNELQNTIQVSNIVYPMTPYYGKKAFEECFRKVGKEYRYVKSEHGEFLSYSEIGKYSPKIKSILDYVINSEGIVFVYSQYLYAGIYPLALALEHIGFKKYNAANVGTNMRVDNKFKASPSYVVISRDQELSPHNNREIAIAKSPENLRGEVIKVVIVSRVGTEGIDFKRIREVHILEPWFNLNRIEQVVGRAVRTCSHIDLPKEERNVTVYMHACTLPKEDAIDVRTYKLAARKQKTIKQVERILQESAIDCNLNLGGLDFPAEKLKMHIPIVTSQGTRIAKHPVGSAEEHKLKCDPRVNVSTVDTTTFHPLFIVDDIDLYKKYVGKLYYASQEYDYDEILKLVKETYKEIDEETLAFALQEMVDTKYKFANGIGRLGYLQYRGQSYLFQEVRQHETRLSLEERLELKKASRITIDPLFDQEKKETPLRQPTPRDYNPVEKIRKLRDTFAKYAHGLDITDAVLDRLEIIDMQHLMKYPDTDRALYDALKASPYIYNDKYICKDEVYNLETLQPIGPLEKSGLNPKTFEMPSKYYGFLKDGSFKVRDPDTKNKGFICHQTSTFKTEMLIERINQLYPGTVDPNKPYVKAALCNLYELALRNKKLFLRKI